MIYWITGRSSSGKTVYAKRLKRFFEEIGEKVLLLDGDEVRDQFKDKVVVRTRNKVKYSSVGYYTQIFLENEFYMLKKIQAKRPTMLYGRLIKYGEKE